VIVRVRRTRERRNFDRALALFQAGVNTALPLALLEQRGPQRGAWLITQFLPDAVDLDQVVLLLLPQLPLDRARAVRNKLITSLVEMLHRLETHNLHHRDLKASNFLVTNWDAASGEPRIWIVDLDGLSLHRPLIARKRWQPLMRLAASLLGYHTISRTDYTRFLKVYLTRMDAPHAEWKTRFRELQRRAAAYVRRAQRRKRHKLDGYEADV
jgi:tRNA A-37 threonylcarbamoyl transferase component Bud32